jgi:TetR/AcrR family tetracycline transcriptional repressor
MAIYHHLPGKEAVVSGLVEVVFAEIQMPPAGSGRWQDRVRDFARSYRELAQAHPNLVLHLVRNAAAGATATLEAGEALYEALDVAGLPPRTVVRAADMVVDYANGFALAEFAGPLGQPGDRRELLTQLKAREDEHFPTMRRVFGALTEDELGADFEFGLDVLIRGLEAIVSDAEQVGGTRS